MVVRLDVDVRGMPGVRDVLKRAEKRAEDLRPVLRGPITNSIHQFFRRQFASDGAAGGEAWLPLTPTTRILKARSNRSSMGVLRFSNRLWASLTKRSGPESVVIAKPQSLEVGTSDAKAVFHQKGWTQLTIFGRPRLAARRVRPILRSWERLLVRHLEGRRS